MHPDIQQQLIQTRVAELHRQAQHHRIVQSARRANQPPAARAFPGRALRHLLPAALTGYGQRLRPGHVLARSLSGIGVEESVGAAGTCAPPQLTHSH